MSVNEFVVENILEYLESNMCDSNEYYLTSRELRDLWLPVKQTFKKSPDFNMVVNLLDEKHNLVCDRKADHWLISKKN